MSKTLLRVVRLSVKAMYATAERWEDGNPDDYRFSALTSGLWRVLEALKALIDDESDPHLKRAHIAARLPLQRDGEKLTERYTNEFLLGSHIPVRSVEN